LCVGADAGRFAQCECEGEHGAPPLAILDHGLAARIIEPYLAASQAVPAVALEAR